jgi:aspartate-semialdehyde dehydrogenase
MNLENALEKSAAERSSTALQSCAARSGGVTKKRRGVVAFKFGGSSLLGAERMVHAARLVLAEESSVCVVVSAMKGVTDHLLSIEQILSAEQNRAAGKLARAHREAEVVLDLHVEVLDDLRLDVKKDRRVRGELQLLGRDLLHEVVVHGRNAANAEFSERLASFGERFSARLFAAALEKLGIASVPVTSSEFMLTCETFRDAQPHLEETKRRGREILLPLLEEGIVPVVTGFIGATPDGRITTLGRNSSDFSGAIIAHVVDAEELVIWTDVDGIYTANPQESAEARLLHELSYEEARALAASGAKVLHPKVLPLAAETEMVVWVRNTFNPQARGTRIGPAGEFPSPLPRGKCGMSWPSPDGGNGGMQSGQEEKARAKGVAKKWRVGVLGATGIVGQRLVKLLGGHAWFELTEVAASERSSGRTYAEAVRWHLETPIPEVARDLVVKGIDPVLDCDFVFSALDSSVAGSAEEDFARAGYPVVSNSRNHRMDADVPLLIPEVNAAHLDAIPLQQKNRGYDTGFIVTNPNCSTAGLVLVLKPLADAFGLEKIFVVTLQAISGAGYPGVASMDIQGNVVPFISGEEEKMEAEPQKLLGRWDGARFVDAGLGISAQCNRVPVLDGHLECLSVGLKKIASLEEVREALRSFEVDAELAGLPSALRHPVVVVDEENRPQPRRDVDTGNGMAAVVGRIRECPLHDIKLTLLSHNLLRGAAGAALLNAELLAARGFLKYRAATSIHEVGERAVRAEFHPARICAAGK